MRLFVPALAFLLAALVFLAEGRLEFNWADEGFLWLGSLRTLRGEVPIRDFEAYEPGRYYWCAAWLALLDPGIVSLRVALAAFQGAGLTLGLLAATRLSANRWLLALVGLCLALWMFPRNKIFESSLAMAAVYVAVRVIERPSRSSYFAAGVFVGFAAFMGRNHGLYCAVAFVALLAFLEWKMRAAGLAARLRSAAAGVVVGYAPMLAMLAFVPGFFEHSWATVVTMLWRSSAMTSLPVTFNVPIPVPWPWRVDVSQTGLLRSLPAFGKGALFVLYPLLCLAAAARVRATPAAQLRSCSVLLASLVVGVPYMHHAFSRPDLQHLAESSPPLLLGVGALASSFGASRFALPLWLAFLVTSAAGGLPSRPLGQRLMLPVSEFVAHDLAGDRLLLPRDKAARLEELRRVVDAYAPRGNAVWFAPHYPGVYPALGRSCPTWVMYPLFPAQPEQQRELIADIDRRGVALVLVDEQVLDGREDLRLRNSHPLLWAHLLRDFEQVGVPRLAEHTLWLRKTRE